MEQKIYDFVIIGSGLGGLVTAAILSMEGKSVCVLEKNDQIGGSLQTFKRGGEKFDTGVHYIGGLDKGQNLYSYFNYLGIMDKLKIQKMDKNGFDQICFKNDSQLYPIGMGYTNFKNLLIELFPDEKDAIDTYCQKIISICNYFPLYNVEPTDYSFDINILSINAKEYIESLTTNNRLRGVLAGNNFLYEGIANRSPLYVHALVLNSYIQSSYKVIGGGDAIGKLISRRIKQLGGEIYRKKKVISMPSSEKVISHAITDKGEIFYGKNFISNIHPKQTLDLVKGSIIKSVYINRINKLENTISVFVINALLKPDTIPYTNQNLYYYDSDDVWSGPFYDDSNWPNSYALYQTPNVMNQKYARSISIMAYMRYEEVAQWSESINTTVEEHYRGDSYEKFKLLKANKLIECVRLRFPEIANSISEFYTSTPLTYRDYIGNSDGSLYGIQKDNNDLYKTFISPLTKFENLFQTGQNVNLHGILGVTIGAVLTCSAILNNKDLIRKIKLANSIKNEAS